METPRNPDISRAPKKKHSLRGKEKELRGGGKKAEEEKQSITGRVDGARRMRKNCLLNKTEKHR